MMVREKLTGLAPPPAAREARRPLAAVDRGEGRQGPRRASTASSRTSAPSPRRVNDLLAHLGMADLSDADRAGRGRQRDRRRPGPGERGPGRREPDRRPVAGDAPRGGRDRATTTARRARRRRPKSPSSDMPEESETGDAEEASQPWRPPEQPRQRARRAPTTRPSRTRFDEVVDAADLCDPEELDRLRAYLDKQLASLSGVVARLANRLQRRLMAQQNRAWEFDLEEGVLDPARLSRVIIDPTSALSFKQRARHRFPRHGGDAADRQFRLDARPADHRRGDLRRHPRPHAGALRRERRDPRLHHARLEGRAGARGLAPGRQAGHSRPPQRSAPHHLQDPPTRPGGGRARISA